MEITCLQMDVLISFYIDGELSSSLREKVEQHLKNCPSCRAKFNIINSLFSDLKKSLDEDNEDYSTKTYTSSRYRTFRNNLSAYVDNELPPEENVKIKKYAINNKKARKDLEDTYSIRKLIKDSFRKTKAESKPDFSGKVIKQLNDDDNYNLSFNPLIKVGIAFVMTILVLAAIIIFSLTLQ
jgi:hypothetical protein